MDNSTAKGCHNCRESARTDKGSPLQLLMRSESQDAILYRCTDCGVCWLETHGATRDIPDEDAHRDFPEAFSAERPGDEDYHTS